VGPGCQRLREKKKKERGTVSRRGRQAGGPPGLKGAGAVFLFFLYLFQLHFQIIFHLKFNSNFFSNFSQEFYRLFRNNTSNQKPCKPTDDAHTLVVSKFIKLSLIFLEFNLYSNLIYLNP
jgi:hypothetical protein